MLLVSPIFYSHNVCNVRDDLNPEYNYFQREDFRQYVKPIVLNPIRDIEKKVKDESDRESKNIEGSILFPEHLRK